MLLPLRTFYFGITFGFFVDLQSKAILPILISCFLMEFKVLKQLNLPPETLSLCDEKGEVDKARRPWDIIPSGHKIGTPQPLFKELVFYNFCLVLNDDWFVYP